MGLTRSERDQQSSGEEGVAGRGALQDTETEEGTQDRQRDRAGVTTKVMFLYF